MHFSLLEEKTVIVYLNTATRVKLFWVNLNTLVLISQANLLYLHTPYSLYDGKLGNNTTFAQCFGRVKLHNYRKDYKG